MVHAIPTGLPLLLARMRSRAANSRWYIPQDAHTPRSADVASRVSETMVTRLDTSPLNTRCEEGASDQDDRAMRAMPKASPRFAWGVFHLGSNN